jgi:glycerol-3-phosphate acyltransferase PlsY
MISLLVVLILSYLAGAFPTAILAGRLILKDDIRNHGSGNAGATNVFRVMGWKAALIVVLIDVGKGVLATLLISGIVIDSPLLSPSMMRMCAGFAAIIGHVWTVFAGFGTAFGVLLSLAPIPSLIAFAVWLILVFSTRIVSVGSLSAGIVYPLSLILQRRFFQPELHIGLVVMGLVLGLLIVVTHRTNIRRLLKGEENRFGSSKKKETV